MKVSIIVPVYNVEKYIGKCLDSLVNQTLKDIEIIIINDGSTDGSQKIIDKYKKKYPKLIKSYIKDNRGQGPARNFGLEKAEGKYIGYVDSDDYVKLNMYEKLYNIAVKTNADVVITRDSKLKEAGFVHENYFIKEFEDKKENAFFGNMGVCNKIYRKDLITNNNILFKEKKWYEDFAFTLKVLINAKNIEYYLDESLYYYLERSGSTMNNSNIKRNLEIIDACDDIIDYLRKNKLYKEYYDIIEFLVIDHIYISAIVRIIRAEADYKNKKEIINQLINYIKENFPNYKNNKYIKTLPKNRKIIYNLINVKQYKLINLIFKMKRG